MANEVYALTHDGLASMISARAASRLLDGALTRKGHSADSIKPEEMKDVLLGPVLRELEGILPREGVKRNLKIILQELRQQARELHGASEELVFETSDIQPEEQVEPEMTGERLDTLSDVTLSSFDESPSEAAVATAVAQPMIKQSTRTTLKIKDETELESTVLKFAKLDHVKLVAATRASGEIVLSRGSGYDLNALASLGTVGLKLLKRSGNIRSYYLAHTNAQLFIFPSEDYTVFVIGSSELNLGEVFTTLSTLEEENHA